MRYFILFIGLFWLILPIQAQLYPDRHSTGPSDGWLSCTTSPNPVAGQGDSHWIMFDFKTLQQLNTVKMWNHNDPSNLESGVNTITVHYSTDNVVWTELGQFTIPQASGSTFYEGADVFSFNGNFARYVVITANTNYGSVCSGFDEIRFYLGATVPLELISFESNCINDRNELNWEFGDIALYGSVSVEKSKNGTEWRSIYSTSSIGLLTEKNTYFHTFIDPSKDDGVYRLKMVDQDGQVEYSSIVQNKCSSVDYIHFYPNPVISEMTLEVESLNSDRLDYQIKDVLGSIVQSGSYDVQQGVNEYILNTTELVNGTYFLGVDVGKGFVEKKFVKIQ